MLVKTVTEAQAVDILRRKYDLPVVLWASQHMECGSYQATICDYTSLPGYTVRYACAVYSKEGDLIDRFNVMK